jgi:Protein of unknown function (DUF3987)
MIDWPAPVDPAALHGPAGEFVLLTEPHTESDPMALLSQFLVCFGTAVGRTAHYQVEASKHYANEFIVLVGPSAKGRKGSSWDHVERLMEGVDPRFIDDCVSSGMSSGEGLIAEVADEENQEPDKRRLVVEAEFAQVMKVLSREGNTLSPVVRNAWDGKVLQTMVRNAPLRAMGAHIGIVGHITKEELLRHISGTELANGFFNRFMLVAVQRSKLLPFGGALDQRSLGELRERLVAALVFAARQTEPLGFDDAAREQWIELYGDLSDGKPGLWGAATARAEAHTVRLALLYALLDCSPTIKPEHLQAALAFWNYSSGSAHWVFGDSLGDPTADEIWEMAKLHPDGVTRTEVSDLFSRNKKAREIDRALNALVDAGRLERDLLRSVGAGRPATVWRPARIAEAA